MVKPGSKSKNSKDKETMTLSAEQLGVKAESKRLQERALKRGVLSSERSVSTAPLRPSKLILKCDGRDIVKRGHRKSKYLFAFPGLLAPMAGGKLGDLEHLDSQNPVLYMDFPQGRLKLFGTLVYPKAKYLTLHVQRAGSIACDDCFESMVVFSEVWWVGSKEANPEELKLEMPKELLEPSSKLHKDFDFTGGAAAAPSSSTPPIPPSSAPPPVRGEAIRFTQGGAEPSFKALFEQKGADATKDGEAGSPRGNVKREEDGDEGQHRSSAKESEEGQPRRQSARTVGKTFKFADDDSGDDEEGSSGSSDEEGPANQRKKKRRKKTSSPQELEDVREHTATEQMQPPPQPQPQAQVQPVVSSHPSQPAAAGKDDKASLGAKRGGGAGGGGGGGKLKQATLGFQPA